MRILSRFIEGSLDELRAIAKQKGKSENYRWWMERAEDNPPIRLQCEAIALTRRSVESFMAFARDVGGATRLSDTFHAPMIEMITGYFPKEERHPYRMVLAFRGSHKSTNGSIIHPAREIARATVESDWQDCPVRIALASEKMKLARFHVRQVRRVVESPRFEELFGVHKPDTRQEGGSWAADSFTSNLRKNILEKSPTCMAIALGAEGTGFHFDLIVGDDVMAYESSFNMEQIDKAFELYTLFYSLMDPGAEIVMIGTRWHYDDIYARIKAQTKRLQERNKGKANLSTTRFFREIEIPAERDGVPTFPEEFPEDVLEDKRFHSGPSTYATQFLLKPMSDKDKVFHIKDLRWMDRGVREQLETKAVWAVMGVDPAWISEDVKRRGDADSKAYTVIFTALVDGAYNYYLLDHFRGRIDREEMVKEIWRQWEQYDVQVVGMQQVDYKHLYSEFKRHENLTGKFPYFEFMSSSSRKTKEDRAQGALEGLVKARKLYIYEGLDWLVDEFDQFPYSSTMDGIDALVNLVRVAKNPVERRVKKVDDETTKDIKEVLYGGSEEADAYNAY